MELLLTVKSYTTALVINTRGHEDGEMIAMRPMVLCQLPSVSFFRIRHSRIVELNLMLAKGALTPLPQWEKVGLE